MDAKTIDHFNNIKLVCTQALQAGVIADFETAMQIKISLDVVEKFIKDRLVPELVPSPPPE